jgi:hypothetical protein
MRGNCCPNLIGRTLFGSIPSHRNVEGSSSISSFRRLLLSIALISYRILQQIKLGPHLIEQMQMRHARASQTNATQTLAIGPALAGFAAWQQMMQPRAPITCQQVGALLTCR